MTSPVYVLISAKDAFDQPTRRVYELWQTDFTYFKVVEWGWYYSLTVLDDYSRYILAWARKRSIWPTEAGVREFGKNLADDEVRVRPTRLLRFCDLMSWGADEPGEERH